MGEALNKIRDQLNEFWQSMEKGQKIRLIIAGALSFLIIVGLIVFTSIPQYQTLYSGLDPKSAGEIRDKIKELKIPVKVNGTDILVPKDKIDELRMTLAMEGLPNDDGLALPPILEPKINETSEDKKQKKLLYMQTQIANSIKSLNGVEWAQVNLIIPEESVFVGDTESESTAGIIVKMKPGVEPLNQSQVNGIVQFVCKSVPKLKKENVSINDDTGVSLVAESSELGPQISTQMGMQNKVKNDIKKSITKFLESIFGPSNVSVEVAVKLNFNNEVKNSIKYEPVDEEKKAGIVKNMEEIKKEWIDAGSGGVPGTDTNTDINQYAEVDSSKAQYKEASTVVNYDINETKSQIVKEQGNVESLSISVLVNKSKLKDDALANIEGLKGDVSNLVKFATQGLQLSSVPVESNIYVQVMPFDNSLKESIDAALKKEEEAKKMEQMIMIGTAIAAILVFGIAMFLFIRKKKAPKDLLMETGEGSQFTATVQDSIPIADIEIEEKNEIKKRLEKFINQKPDQVATLLKSWLNEE